MRKITSTILVALLTFSVGFGTVAAKPKGEKPGRDNSNGAITYPFKISGTSTQVGDWICSGVYVQNKNLTRINAECTVTDVEGYAGTYTNESHGIPQWSDQVIPENIGVPEPLMEIVKGLDQESTPWQVVVTPNADGVTGKVEAVVFIKTKD